MTEVDKKLLIEHTRMKVALNSILNYVHGCAFGAWRHHVASIAIDGLEEVPISPSPPSPQDNDK